ncbi:MAG: hypothetical protein ABR953_02590 [Candidatus Acidiferrales bacterium]|jgi:hypothetical protein
MGDALEAAREAELLALERQVQQRRDSGEDDESSTGETADDGSGTGPIHRAETEAAEVVPPYPGRAARGFVARVHRQPVPARGVIPDSPQRTRNLSSVPAPEIHVFSDHRDLMNFLADALAQGAANRP